MKLVISDAHEELKAAVATMFKASWQRCRVHFLRNATARAPKGQRGMVSTLIGTVFVRENAQMAHAQWRAVTYQIEGRFPKIAALMRTAEHEVLAYFAFPREHREPAPEIWTAG